MKKIILLPIFLVLSQQVQAYKMTKETQFCEVASLLAVAVFQYRMKGLDKEVIYEYISEYQDPRIKDFLSEDEGQILLDEYVGETEGALFNEYTEADVQDSLESGYSKFNICLTKLGVSLETEDSSSE